MTYRANFVSGSTHSVVIDKVPSGTRVLDVGCNSGYLGAALRAKSCQVWGVDRVDDVRSSDAYEAIAEVDLDRADIPWPDRRFDVVVAADVLEHLQDPVSVLARLVERLEPGGSAVISVPNVAHISVRARLLLGRFEYADDGILDRTHLRLFTRSSARALVRDAGLAIVDEAIGSDRFGSVLNRHPAVRALLGGVLGFGIIVVGARPT